MDRSRDDFVIAIRSAFLKRGTQQRFSLLALILFSILFLILSSLNFKAVDYIKIALKEIVYRSSYIVSAPEKFIKKNYFIIQNHLYLYEENEKNKYDLEYLKSKDLLNEFIILENQRLKNIVDDYFVKSNDIFAKVINDKGSPFLKSVIINKGSKQNISLGMIVMDGVYLVGKIVEVNYLSSRVLLLSDLNSKIPVIWEPYGVLPILSGTGEKHGTIQYTKKENLAAEGGTIYTSGTGGLFKAGIPVGRIENNNIDNKNNIKFFSNFSQLKFVKVLSFTKIEIE